MPRDAQTFDTGSEEIRAVNPLAIPDWDQQVAAFPAATFFHSQAWVRVLQRTYGYRPEYLMLAPAGRVRAILPLMEVASWLTGKRGVSLPFTDSVPPLCVEPADFRALVAFAQQRARERRWKYLELRGGRAEVPEAAASTRFYQHQLDLRPGADAVAARFDPAVQRAIRKAERSGLTLEFARTEAAMRAFYGLLCQTRQRHGVPPQPYDFFGAIQEHVLAPGHGWVTLARQGDRPVAGAVYFHFGRRALYKFGASDLAFQQLRANNLVMAQTIRRYAAEGMESLDFGRTSLTNEGLRRFKLGWGTQEHVEEYLRFDPRTGTYVTASDDSSGWHTRVFSLLPQWASRRVGALLYPHMG